VGLDDAALAEEGVGGEAQRALEEVVLGRAGEGERVRRGVDDDAARRAGVVAGGDELDGGGGGGGRRILPPLSPAAAEV
jgi:hypothetical protein